MLSEDALHFKGARKEMAPMAQMLLLPSLLNIQCLLVPSAFVISSKDFFFFRLPFTVNLCNFP